MANTNIWFNKEVLPGDIKGLMPSTMGEHLGMEWVEVGPDFLRMKMPVDHRTQQPYGLLHGGASCALAETIGSIASYLVIDTRQFMSVGLEINANHIRSVRNGYVTATARPIHIGRGTHVWDIRIQDDHEKLVCISRLTVAILAKQK